ESIASLAKRFITLPLDSYFVSCAYFVFPLINHKIWCFSIPSYGGEQRQKCNKILHLSGSFFSLFPLLTPPRVVPNVWHFPYFVCTMSTNSLMIKLQPKISDYITLIFHIFFIPMEWVFVWKPSRAIVVFKGFSLFTGALSITPHMRCQIVAPFLIYSIIEFAIFCGIGCTSCEEG
ncbi:hypothetical protein ZWY2020_038128, partial [Hordeum vulgare]